MKVSAFIHGGPPKVSAFIRSYARDFRWLEYCLASLEKRGEQLFEVIVAVPETDLLSAILLNKHGARIIGVQQHTNNGYIDQQITKCQAELYCSGDFIMHLDSDCMAEREIELGEFFVDGQPKLLFRKWEDAGDAKQWKDITKSALIREPSFETMCAMPILYHRSSHELFRRHMADIHGRDFLTYISRLAHFSEFNAIGNFCHLYTPDAYRFIRATGQGDGFPRPIRQFWSHGGIKRQEMEDILK